MIIYFDDEFIEQSLYLRLSDKAKVETELALMLQQEFSSCYVKKVIGLDELKVGDQLEALFTDNKW